MVNSYDWRMYPGNENLTEPLYILPDYIHKYMPWARVIFILRNPVERLVIIFSGFIILNGMVIIELLDCIIYMHLAVQQTVPNKGSIF